MAGNGTGSMIPATIARLWSTISGSLAITAGVGTDSRNGGPALGTAGAGPTLVKIGRSPSPARTAVSLSPSKVRVIGSHWANRQVTAFQRPCCPVYFPADPENVAIKVPAGRKHALLLP